MSGGRGRAGGSGPGPTTPRDADAVRGPAAASRQWRRHPGMLDRRLAPPAAAVWTGCLVATAPGSSGPGVWVAAVVLVVAAAALVGWWRRESRSRPRRPGAHALVPGGSVRLGVALAVASAAAGLAAGAAAMAAHERDPTTVLLASGAQHLEVTAELLGDPRPQRARWAQGVSSADVRVLTVAVPGARQGQTGAGTPAVVRDQEFVSRVRMLGSGRGWEHLARGDLVRMEARVSTTFRAEPPWAGVLRGDDPEILQRPGGWRGAVREVRAALLQASAGLDGQGRALVPGMAVGDDRRMDAQLREDMLTSSLTHLTAVSGSHVAIMLGVVVALVPGRGAARAGAALVTMALLVAVVGPEPSVVRSVSTAGVGVVGLLLRRPGQAQSALCAVATLLLLADPWSARSFGFALSVLATWGVVGPAASLQRWWEQRVGEHSGPGRLLGRLGPVVSVPVAAQLMVAPVLLLLNPWLPLWGVVANVAAAPAVAPASLLGIAAAAVAWWWPGGASWLCQASSLFTGWIAGVASVVAGWPGARMPWPGGVRGALALTALVALVVAAQRLGRRWWRVAPEAEEPGAEPARTGSGGEPTPGAHGAWETVLRPPHDAGERR